MKRDNSIHIRRERERRENSNLYHDRYAETAAIRLKYLSMD